MERRKEEIRRERESKEGMKEDQKVSSSDLPAFRLSEFVSLRVKVRQLDEGYAPRGKNSSYLVYFNHKGCLAVFPALRSCLARFWDCWECCPILTLHFAFIFRTDFRLGNE